MRIGIISAGALFAMTSGLLAQSNGNPTSETSRALDAAKSTGQAEAGQIAREQASDGGSLTRLAQQAQRSLTQASDGSDRTKLAADGLKLDETLRSLSPQAQKILAQNSPAPALRAPDPDSVARVPVATAIPDLPKPKAAAAADPAGAAADPAAKKDNDIHITSQGVAYFDSKESIGIFTDDVEVTHPQFHLTCDQLEIYMLKDNEKPAAPAATPTAPAKGAAALPVVAPGTVVTSASAGRISDPDAPAGAAPAAAGGAAAPVAAAAAPQPDSSIKQAIARGRKVVIVKAADTGEAQIGVCRTATYVGANGDIYLRDMPMVQRGKHVHYATDPSTYMIIKQDGKLHTFGPAKVDIIEEAEKKAPAPGAPPVAPTAPAPGPAKPGPGKPGKKGKL